MANKFSLMILLASLLLAFSPLSAPDVKACVICVPYPEKTLTDRLLAKSDIFFARELAETPYMFSPVEYIEGTQVDQPIKLFCDSHTRRKLSVITESVVVVARNSSSTEWEIVTFADAGLQSFIRSAFANSKEWGRGGGNQDRVDYFAQFLTSEHPDIQEQAYLEVGRAPYAMIKKVATTVPREQLYGLLKNYQYVEWHNLYILILGQSQHPEDHAYIRTQVEDAAKYRSATNLSAWLTAFIETNPDSAVDEVEKVYFSRSGRNENELKQVLESLLVQGSQENFSETGFSLRDEIVKSYGALLENYPEMAGKVAKHLVMWQVRAHLDQLSAIKEAGTIQDVSEKLLLDYYLSVAPTFAISGF